jgi:hypothetical protein
MISGGIEAFPLRIAHKVGSSQSAAPAWGERNLVAVASLLFGVRLMRPLALAPSLPLATDELITRCWRECFHADGFLAPALREGCGSRSTRWRCAHLEAAQVSVPQGPDPAIDPDADVITGLPKEKKP